MKNSTEVVFDLNSHTYNSSFDLFIVPVILLLMMAYLFFVYKNKFKGKIKGLSTIYFYIGFAFSVYIPYNDFKRFEKNEIIYKTGGYKVLEGAIEEINTKAATEYQSITVQGITLFLKKGNNISYSGDLSKRLEVGESILIKYVHLYDGIVQIIRKPSAPGNT